MPWNRRELYIGNSRKEFNNVCGALSSNGVKYSFRTINCNRVSGPGSKVTYPGLFARSKEDNFLYYVYVHKNDYEYANALINKKL